MKCATGKLAVQKYYKENWLTFEMLYKRYKRQRSKAVVNGWIYVHKKTGRILHDAVEKYNKVLIAQGL
tara:strand:- start:506 stop:709 length:204 start_codon:yes stop_codon:yes gene_type:complete